MEQFFIKYCPNGHTVYALDSPPEDKRCPQCGGKLFSECPSCGKRLPNSFQSIYLSTRGRPARFPKRPDYCSECGDAFPWAQAFYSAIDKNGIWGLIHHRVVNASKSRFESGHYADSVEAAFKEVNVEVKRRYLDATGKEEDGTTLMRRAFSGDSPAITLTKMDTTTGKNIQEGYQHIFAGAMQGIRNPNAHSNVDTPKENALHLLFLASLLFYKLDEALIA